MDSRCIFFVMSTSPCTALTDFRNAERSLGVNLTSTIRSIPLAPIITGTPTYRFLTQYCTVNHAAAGRTRFLSFRYDSAMAMADEAGA